MKRLLITLTVLSIYSLTYSQTVEDFFKFDDKGIVCEFQKTYTDGTVINYKKGEIATIRYKDGVLVDFSQADILTNAWNQQHEMNNWYKSLRSQNSLPYGVGMPFSWYNISFPDNSSVSISDDHIDDYGNYGGYIDVAANGDSARFGQYGEVLDVNCHIGQCLVSGVFKDYGKMEGTILLDNNKLYEGTFSITTDESREETIASPYLHSFFLQYFRDNLDYGLNSITGFKCIDGRVIDNNGAIVGMYKWGKELDEFDLAAVLAAEQGKLEREKAAAQERKARKDNLIAKFGQKYVDALYDGEVIVGMPWELVELGVSTHSFKKFTYTTLNYTRGNSKCYSLRSYGYSRPGYLWVTNGKVESVSYYY